MNPDSYQTKKVRIGEDMKRIHFVLSIVVLLTTQFIFAQECDVNPYAYEFNGSITAHVLIDGEQVSEGTLLAFVGEECRGEQEVLYFPPAADYYFPTMTYSNVTEGEILTFKYVDSAQNVFELDGSHEFISDMTVGNGFEAFELHGSDYFGGGDDISDWVVNPYAYEFNGSLTAHVIIDDVVMSHGTLAAFYNDEVRGVQEAIFFPPAGNYYFPIMTYSNATSGEIFNFKYFNGSEIIDLNETLEFVSDMTIGNGFAPFELTGESDFVSSGCIDTEACNYDETATLECDNCCEYPEENYDCDGNCIVDIDCSGECGGSLELDDCGVCDGGNANIDECGVCFGENDCFGCTDADAINFDDEATIDDGSCIFEEDTPPELFQYTQSSLQAFYFFNIASVDGTPLSGDDWVGAFNGDICVGSRKWDTSECEGNVCEVPVMGDDGEVYSDGYMNEGEFPTFMIYDASENEFYNAVASENFPWSENTQYMAETLNVYPDCFGELGGSAELDDCGVCEGGNADMDECGECFGSGYIDECGTCDDDPSNDCVQDCNGDWGGSAELDDCGVCEGDNATCTGCTDPEAINYDPEAIVSCDGCCEYTYTLDLSLNMGANLVSFNVLPENASIINLMEPIAGNLYSVNGESNAAQFTDNGIWIGSLTMVDQWSGYWMILNNDELFSIEGYPTDPGEYALHYGANLLSYPFNVANTIEDALPSNAQEHIYGIMSEDQMAIQVDGDWVGSLTHFESGKGYWFKTDQDVSFSYNEPNLSRFDLVSTNQIPEEFEYIQSSKRAFYMIENINIAEDGDWVIAYNDDVIIGAREWTGSMTDIPAMGDDNQFYSTGYCDNSSSPHFRLMKYSTGEVIDLFGNIPTWENDGILFVTTLSDESNSLPSEITLNSVYPNPFNPVTTIKFAVETQNFVSLQIFNINGQLIETLVDGNVEVGSHEVNWNATNHSSGIYFVQLQTEYTSLMQKVMLLK